MERIKGKILCGVAGATSGLSGILTYTRCSGNSCGTCLGCIGVGAGLLVAVLAGMHAEERN